MHVRTVLRTATMCAASVLALIVGTPVQAVDDIDSSPFIVKNELRVRADEHSGAFTYAYPLTLPPGRNGMQPGLALAYNSANTDVASPVGYGWSLSLPVIARINRYGADDLYSNHDFTSTHSGELDDVALTDGMHGTYGAKVDDGSFLSYAYNADDTWTVTDKLGTVYTFGATNDAQLVDPADATRIFRWHLTEIRDTNDNTVTYAYTKDGEQVYPSTIAYTGHDTESGIFAVSFALEARSDASTSYAPGFAVTTSYRVSDIAVAVDGTTVRTFALDYTTGDNGVRSLLASVTETGTAEGGTGSSKPPTTFTYQTAERAYTEVADFTFPIAIGNTGAGSMGVFVFDVNGDALPDVVKSQSAGAGEVYINNGDNTWTQDANYVVPIAFVTPIGRDMGVRVFDVDGDGFQDLVWSWYTSTGTLEGAVYSNNADGTGWTEDPAFDPPTAFTSDGGVDIGSRIFDVDGDGMQDIVTARNESYGLSYSVSLNNGDGTGWTAATDISVPIGFATSAGLDMGVRAFDVNGDNLIDLVYSREDTSHVDAVYINQGGTGWTEDANYTVPISFVPLSTRDLGVRMVDVNGDYLTDLMWSRYESTGTQVDALYINNGDGTGWTQDAAFSAPIGFTTDGGLDIGVREIDVDGDMLDDIIYSRMESSVTTSRLWLADGGRADVLAGIAYTQGATTSVAYTTSVEGNPDLWFPLHVVASITTDDGLGNTATTSYGYEDGEYYYADEYDRKFAGFGTVQTTDGNGNVTTEYFHQGNATNSSEGESTDDVSTIGKRYREEIRNSSGTLYRTTIASWTNADLGNDRDFVYQNQSLELLYDGDSDHRDKATTFTYDTASGNLSEKKDWGLVTGTDAGTFTDSGADIARTSYSYAAWTAGGTSAYQTQEILRDYYGNRWRHTLWYYDGLAFGSVADGNRTKESRWVSGSAVVDTVSTYDSYGMVATVTDPLGNVTTYTSDTHHLYPATVTDALGYATQYAYDYSSGKVTSTTDANGLVFATDYDGFDRPTGEWQPDPDAPTSLVTKTTYAYDDTSVPSSVQETAHIDAATSRDVYTYLDGFGRVVQRREEANGTSYNVTDMTYDELGRLERTSLPYASTGSARTSATTDTSLYETLAYDALGRVTSAANAVGTHSKAYEDWWVTEVDANGEAKLYYYDAYNRLAIVGERLGTSTTYTTSYTWTAGGDLAKITDGAGNIRQFSFDNLGRRTVARDLRASSDTAYGSWTFTYDNGSNMATSVSPNGVTTTYAYDDRNRVTSEDASSASGVEVAYAYDSCTNGLERLCTVTVASGATTAYVYDALGRVATETKTIDGTSYATSYAYDRQGSVSRVTYPDGSEASYGLDNAGAVTDVFFTDVHGNGVETVASGITYGAHGKPTSVTYGNGVTTAWTYDAAELYRLTDLVTVSGATTLEDFSYGYDNAGNMTSLVDASDFYADMTIAYGYDDLSRITSATSTSVDAALAYSKTWTYGAIGNILTSTDCGTYRYLGYQSGNYANPHAVTSVCGKTYAYDRNGNVTSDGTWTNVWNWRNEMTSSTNGTTTVAYQYDHEGNRVLQETSSRAVVYPNSAYTVEGSDVRRHMVAGALGSVATSIWDGTDSDIVYHHNDHLGGTHVETDESGAVLEYIVYNPFGGVLADVQSGSYENDHKFTGKERDDDTGYYYYGARYYQADIGRFLSQDPVYAAMGADGNMMRRLLKDPQLMNSYTYTRNNPIVLVDPDGQFAFFAPLVAFALGNMPAIISGGAFATSAIGSVMLARSYDDMTSPSASLPTRVLGAAGLAASVSPIGSAASAAKNAVPAASGAATSVYNAMDDVGRTVYVGITNNLERRAAEHLATKGITISPIQGLTNLARDVARGAEQALIEAHGFLRSGGSLINKINSISTKNPSYQQLVDQGRNLLNKLTE